VKFYILSTNVRREIQGRRDELCTISKPVILTIDCTRRDDINCHKQRYLYRASREEELEPTVLDSASTLPTMEAQANHSALKLYSSSESSWSRLSQAVLQRTASVRTARLPSSKQPIKRLTTCLLYGTTASRLN
jgi:hypothetical protein